MDFKKTEAPELPGIEAVLTEAVHRGWIRGFRLAKFVALKDLHLEWGKSDLHQVSRTHKNLKDRCLLAIEVIKEPRQWVGIDLETKHSLGRALFKRLDWLRKRFNTPKSTTPEDLLIQWTVREAAFKALYPDNDGLVLSDFKLDRLEMDAKFPLPKDHELRMEAFRALGKKGESLRVMCFTENEFLLSLALKDS